MARVQGGIQHLLRNINGTVRFVPCSNRCLSKRILSQPRISTKILSEYVFRLMGSVTADSPLELLETHLHKTDNEIGISDEDDLTYSVSRRNESMTARAQRLHSAPI